MPLYGVALAALLAAAAVSPGASPQPTDPFIERLEAVPRRLGTQFDAIRSQAQKGDVEGANANLVALAKKDGTPEAAFWVANMLYHADPDASYALHQQVYQALPNELPVRLEWAMELHRRGQYAEALPQYEAYLKAFPHAHRLYALTAECHLRLGQLKEAVADWHMADHPHHHSEIEEYIHEIHDNAVPPSIRRAALLRHLKQGDQTVAEQIIDLDTGSGERSEGNEHWLNDDLPVVERALGPATARAKQLHLWAALTGVTDDKAVRSELKKAGLLVEGGVLPASSLAASRIIALAVDAGALTLKELLPFQKELTARAHSKAGDVDALNLLWNIVPENERPAIDEYGWSRYGDIRSALSVLLDRHAAGKLKPDSPKMVKALQQFPDDGRVYSVLFAVAGPEWRTKERLVAAILAEYHHLSESDAGYSYFLNAYFEELATKL